MHNFTFHPLPLEKAHTSEFRASVQGALQPQHKGRLPMLGFGKANGWSKTEAARSSSHTGSQLLRRACQQNSTTYRSRPVHAQLC